MRLCSRSTSSQRWSPRCSVIVAEPSMSLKRMVTVPSGAGWRGGGAESNVLPRHDGGDGVDRGLEVARGEDALGLELQGQRALEEMAHAESSGGLEGAVEQVERLAAVGGIATAEQHGGP